MVKKFMFLKFSISLLSISAAALGMVALGSPVLAQTDSSELDISAFSEEIEFADAIFTLDDIASEGILEDYVTPKGYSLWNMYVYGRNPGGQWIVVGPNESLSPSKQYRLVLHHGHLRLSDLPEFYRENLELRVVHEGTNRQMDHQRSLIFFTGSQYTEPVSGQKWRTTVRRPGRILAIDPSVFDVLYFKVTESFGPNKSVRWNIGFYMENYWWRWNRMRFKNGRFIE